VRWRRPNSLLIYWDQGELVVEDYFTRETYSVDPAAVRILNLFSQWRRAADIPALDTDFSLAEASVQIRHFEHCGLLLREGSPAARRDAKLHATWRDWLPQASFHFATKDGSFLTVSQAEKHYRALAAKSRPPAKFKSYPKVPRVPLPKENPVGADTEFPRVLLARRTHRRFSPQSLSLNHVSKLLYYTWGVTGSVNSPTFGPLPAKTSPSGGARHPVEVYLLALRVEGLAQGLYHYDCRGHRLALLRSGNFSRRAGQYCAGQKWVGEAGAVFLMTAVFPRSQWKYRDPRAYRVVLLDAGHLGQTFCLVATWLGLAPFSTAALKDTRIENDLGLDGISESVLFVNAVGVPVSGRGSSALPRK
jgi:SagB-type dehydrogenase family enzyme